MAICAGGFPKLVTYPNGKEGDALHRWEKAYDSKGHWISNTYLDLPSGYFYKSASGVSTPMSLRDLYSNACKCDGAVVDSCCANHDCLKNNSNSKIRALATYRESFCAGLVDSAGNKIKNLPAVCGGTGPEVYVYNSIVAALDYSSAEGASLMARLEAQTSSKVKKITNAGMVIALLLLLFGLMLIFF